MAVRPQRIDAYIKQVSKGRSPLVGMGAAFVDIGRQEGVSPYLLAAIAGAESGFGTTGGAAKTRNPFGWGPGKSFSSWEEAIRTVARGLRTNYLARGLTSIPQIGAKYAPAGAANDPTGLNGYWTRNVGKHFQALGGGPIGLAGGNAAEPSAGTLVAPRTATITTKERRPDLAGAALAGLQATAQGQTDPLAQLQGISEAVQNAPEVEIETQVPLPEVAGGVGNDPPGTPGMPLPTKMGASSFAVQDAEGAPAQNGKRYHAAVDWFAPPGSLVRAPFKGKVVEVKRSQGTGGQVFGGVVKIQLPNGHVVVFRHVNPTGVKLGQMVDAGAPLARVTRWSDNPKSSHAHVEVWRTLEGGYRFENMLDPSAYFGRGG